MLFPRPKVASMKHLQPEERHAIQMMKQQGHSQHRIADHLGRSAATISRELKRNSLTDGDDSAIFAHQFACKRARGKPHYQSINSENQRVIEAQLHEKLSPEQIIGRAHQQQISNRMPSITTLYRHVHADRKRGGTLYRHLRHQGARRKQHGQGKMKRSTVPNRIDISQRPHEVEKRERLGDFECDLMIGAAQSGALLTVNCRSTGKVWIKKIPNKEAPGVRDALIEILTPYKDHLHTITSDNGREFSLHEIVAERLNCVHYVATPYHSWERGSNENLNGLIRQYDPKKMECWSITQKHVEAVADALNNRPRKRYKFYTPNEIYEQKLKNN
jgi:IS30 family transposase